jgi:FkbM family methyltransferase
MLTRAIAVASQFTNACSKLGYGNAIRLYLPTFRDPMTLALGNGGEFRIRRNGIDRGVFLSVFRDRQYPTFAGIEINTILDAGANIGSASRWWLQFHPHARIVAVEPDAGNFSLLEKNLAAYGSQVSLVRGAVWHESGQVRLDRSSACAASFRVGPKGDAPVEAFTIDDLAGKMGVKSFDIVKLDIEGAEREIFASSHASKWLDLARVVIVEIHEDYAPGVGREMAKAFANRDHALFLSGENLVWIPSHDVRRMRAAM